MLTTVLALVLIPPVAGAVERPYDYDRPFAPGRHRGIDLRAPAGTPVQAPCAGTVEAAGPVAGTGVVSIRCANRRISLLPLRAITVRAQEHVRANSVVGVTAKGHHHTLHLGVRDEENRLAYQDPEPLLTAPAPPPPSPLPLPAPPQRPPKPPPPAPPAPEWRAVQPDPHAPWLAFAGLGLATAGLVTRGVTRRRRRLRASPAWNRASA